MEKHFVTFFYPGTFCAEFTSKSIDAWNVDEAVEMARSIVERHGAKPYGFQFSTRGREDDELDSKVIDKSGMYFLGGEVSTVEQVRKRADPSEKILLSNMEINGYEAVVHNKNSYSWTQPLGENDVVLDVVL